MVKVWKRGRGAMFERDGQGLEGEEVQCWSEMVKVWKGKRCNV